jgi:hypothetical protein
MLVRGLKNKMKWLIGLLVGLVVADGVLTNILVNNGLAREGNPLLEPLIGDIGFLIVKVVGALACALILWDISRRYPKLARYATCFFLVVYSGIVLWNSSLFMPG